MIRHQVRARIAALLADEPELANVECLPRFPGDKADAPQMIFGTGTEGEVTFPYSPASSAQRDNFDASFVVLVAGLGSVDECAERAQQITATAISTIQATGLTLDEYEVNDEKVCEVGPFTVTTADFDGNEGPWARTEITVSIETQTT